MLSARAKPNQNSMKGDWTKVMSKELQLHNLELRDMYDKIGFAAKIANISKFHYH